MQKGGEEAMTKFKNQYRYLAQITLETSTPLQIGGGGKGIKTDSPVVRDVNDLPFIPGTTLAGLIAHALGSKKERLMGSQQEGSRLIVTEAKLLDKYGKVVDGLLDFTQLDANNRAFLKHYEQLPIRQHVRICHKGTAEDTGKFDEEIVLKGSRFSFEMELIASNNESEAFDKLLTLIQSPTFRIGSGSRSGFGQVKVVKCRCRTIDLEKEDERKLYLSKSSKLGADWNGWQDADKKIKEQDTCEGWTLYKLVLSPEDFLLFGSGFSDPMGEADMTYVRETYITWNENGTLATEVNFDKVVLIPGSSVKGAISHRTAFHYNKERKIYAENLTPDEAKQVVGKYNDAVKAIFGSEGERNPNTNKMENKQRGNILISDVIEVREQAMPKVLNHVSIDRFTGGAINGALFNEQTLYAKGEKFEIDLMVANEAIADDDIRRALEKALKDVATGLLPLGGGVNRGNGVFIGKVTKFNKEKWEELK